MNNDDGRAAERARDRDELEHTDGIPRRSGPQDNPDGEPTRWDDDGPNYAEWMLMNLHGDIHRLKFPGFISVCYRAHDGGRVDIHVTEDYFDRNYEAFEMEPCTAWTSYKYALVYPEADTPCRVFCVVTHE